MPSNAPNDVETTKSNPTAKKASLSEGPPRNSNITHTWLAVVQRSWPGPGAIASPSVCQPAQGATDASIFKRLY